MLDINPEDLKSPHALQQAEKRFEWSINFLIVNYRFVHQVLGILVKVSDPRIETMGVRVLESSRMELVYNPAFTMALTDDELVYVLFHEVLHLVLHHCTSRKFDNHKLGNIACDLAVNELIPVRAGSCDLPRDKNGKIIGCLVSEMKKKPEFADILEKQTAEWYYDYLLSKQKKEEDKGGAGKNKMPGGLGDNHDGWKEDEIADEKVRAKVEEIDKCDLWGSETQGFKENILAAQTRRINWMALIRRTFGNILWKDRESTRKRPNRRTGYTHPGYKKTYVERGLASIDTSGSMPSNLLGKFLTVMNGISDTMPIDLMQFDCSVTEEPKPFRQHKQVFDFRGRGGTDFEPVIQAAIKGHYRILLIMTDGEAAPCTRPPSYMHVIWVMPVGHKPPVDWGDRVYLTEHC
jgi:predicted metal-dependent peptidase